MKVESNIKYNLCELDADEIEVIIHSLAMFDCYNEDASLNAVAGSLTSNIKCACGYIS